MSVPGTFFFFVVVLCVQDRNNSVGEDAEKRNSNDEENDRKKGRSGDKTTYTVRSSVSMDTASLDSTHHGSKILKKNSRKFPKAKLEFATCRQLLTYNLHCIYKYIHSIDIVLGIINNLKMF